MLRPVAGLVLATLLGVGCSKPETPLQKAARNYTFVRSHGTIADLCAAAESGKAAAVDARDTAEYQTWENRTIQHCRLQMR